jgi:hypothetical protein
VSHAVPWRNATCWLHGGCWGRLEDVDAAHRDGKRVEHKNAVLQDVTGRMLSHAVGGADPFAHLEGGCAWGQRVIGFVSGLINALETHARAHGLCVLANASDSCILSARCLTVQRHSQEDTKWTQNLLFGCD